jgi:hypothetical protein
MRSSSVSTSPIRAAGQPIIDEVLASHPLSPGGTAGRRFRPPSWRACCADCSTTSWRHRCPAASSCRRWGAGNVSSNWVSTCPPRLTAPSDSIDWLAAHGYPLPRLGFPPLDGYLKGFIDLVFCHANRFHVLDWKSNHLGFAAADYGQQQVAAAMAEHGYHLQYLIYCVALHRYLRCRIADYDYDRHFGGVHTICSCAASARIGALWALTANASPAASITIAHRDPPSNRSTACCPTGHWRTTHELPRTPASPEPAPAPQRSRRGLREPPPAMGRTGRRAANSLAVLAAAGRLR